MSRLERYLGEREEHSSREERELQCERSQALQELLDAYEAWFQDLENDDDCIDIDAQECATNRIEGIEYSPEDVLEFSRLTKAYEDRDFFFYTGIFFSTLVNEGKDDRYTILTEHLDTRLNNIGYAHGRKRPKELEIIGDVGNYTGKHMFGGLLTISGDAGYSTGLYMSGGCIKVAGDIEHIYPHRVFGAEIWKKGRKVRRPLLDLYNIYRRWRWKRETGNDGIVFF